jgi:nicotinamidase/pyrazinamidase
MSISRHDALIVVDPQNDFLPGGLLPVEDGNRIFRAINAIAPSFSTVYFTRDWPAPGTNVTRFHPMPGTNGAEFSPLIDRGNAVRVIDKSGEEFSPFPATGLADELKRRDIRRVFVCGLATDYCIKATALDARANGFDVTVVLDGVAAYDLEPDDEAKALDEMRAAGVALTESGVLLVLPARP